MNLLHKYILLFIRGILTSLTYSYIIKQSKGLKKYMGYICRFLFKSIKYDYIWSFYNYLASHIMFKDNLRVVDRRGNFDLWYYVKDFKSGKEINFENTKINIPAGYDSILKNLYGDYMKFVIFPGGHNCLYSVKKSYKELKINGKININELFSL